MHFILFMNWFIQNTPNCFLLIKSIRIVEYRKLGTLGIEVGTVGLGVEHLKNKPIEETSDVIREAVGLGVNYFDLVWSFPQITSAIGEGIRGNRKKVNLVVHLGSCYRGDKYVRNRTVKKCREVFEEVLGNLGTEYADVINLHYVNEKDYSKIFKEGGILDLAKELVEEGKGRSIGLSTHDIDIVRRIASNPDINSVMFQVNMANHYLPGRDEAFELCVENGKGIVAMKPFAKAKLLKPNRKEKVSGYMTGGIVMKTKIPKGMTSAKCLHYSLSQPGVKVVVPGASSIEELRDCVNYYNVPVEEKVYETELEELFLNRISE